jgi:hypothetical protein
MKASKVSINPDLEIIGSIRFHNQSFVLSSLEVSENHLDSRGMTLLWIIVESSNL